MKSLSSDPCIRFLPLLTVADAGRGHGRPATLGRAERHPDAGPALAGPQHVQRHRHPHLRGPDPPGPELPPRAVAGNQMDLHSRRRRCASTCASGVKFHDGSPFTADDVVFSFGRITQPQGTKQTYVSGIKEVREDRRPHRRSDPGSADADAVAEHHQLPHHEQGVVDKEQHDQHPGLQGQGREFRERATPTAPAPTSSSAGSPTKPSRWWPTRTGGTRTRAT